MGSQCSFCPGEVLNHGGGGVRPMKRMSLIAAKLTELGVPVTEETRSCSNQAVRGYKK